MTALCSLFYLWSPCPVLLPGSRLSSSGSPQLCASGQIQRHCTRECCLVQRQSPAVHSHLRFSPLVWRTTGRVVTFMPHLKHQPSVPPTCNQSICYFKEVHLMLECFVKVTFRISFKWLYPNFVQYILARRCISEINICLAWILPKQQ